MKKKTSIVTVLVVSLSFFARIAGAQGVAMPDEDWGEHQNFQKAAEYWATWEKSGPDTNIAEARRQAQKEFSAIPRSKAMMLQAVTPAWKQVGGVLDGVVSGRPTGLGFSKQHPAYIYLATSGGGLFKSTNSGGKWVPINDPNFTTNAMGSVAVDPTNDSIVYVGTGDLYTGNDGELSKGDGMFKSVDGGLNWTHIASTNQVGSLIYQVLIDPVTTSRLYTTANDGIRRSEDGGQTWKKVLPQSGTTHMIIDPNNPNRLIAGGAGVIKISADYGDTWTGDVAANLTSKYTVTLGMSMKNSAIVYASIGLPPPPISSGNSLGVAISVDSGKTWSITSNPGGGYMSQQSFYDNACAVSPSSPNYVIVGGLDIYASANGGTSFPYKTDWTSAPGGTNYTHADIHVLTYGGGGLWALTDGGVFQSGDNGKTWSPRNSGLATLLFVGGDADKNFTFALGGAQDNGVSKTNAKTGTTFTQKVGGDGGRCYVDQIDGLVCYSTYVSASLQRSPDGGETWDIGPRGDHNVIPNGCSLLNENVPFYMYYDVCESDPSVVAIAGGANVYYTTDGANTLNSISKSGTKPSLNLTSTVHVPAANSAVVYCSAGGTSYVTKEATLGAWTKSSVSSLGTISDWASDPEDAGHVWVAIAGFGGHHFAESNDYGSTWSYPAVGLPNLDYRAIARAPNGDLFLGHTLGVMRSIDGGVTWEPLTDGIPLAQVNKLRVRGSSPSYLLATTYGRGMYSLNITDLPRTTFDVPQTVADVPLSISTIAPNPAVRAGNVTIRYSTNNPGWVNMRLFDEAGRELRTIANEYSETGSHTVAFATPEIAGSYTIVMTQNGKAVTAHLVVSGS